MVLIYYTLTIITASKMFSEIEDQIVHVGWGEGKGVAPPSVSSQLKVLPTWPHNILNFALRPLYIQDLPKPMAVIS